MLAGQKSWALLGRTRTSGHWAQIGGLFQVGPMARRLRFLQVASPLQEPVARPRQRNRLAIRHLSLEALSCVLVAPLGAAGAPEAAPSAGASSGATKSAPSP